jgi:hypothetical protein
MVSLLYLDWLSRSPLARETYSSKHFMRVFENILILLVNYKLTNLLFFSADV